MTTNLYEASRQWATRPADERFGSIDELLEFTQRRMEYSKEHQRALNSMQVNVTSDGGLLLNGSSRPSYFSHWAFGQASRMIGAPAHYLRDLSPELARDCLQYGLSESDQSSLILTRNNPPHASEDSTPIVSAFTGPKYGRIWDADVVGALARAIQGTSWHVPKSAKRHSENSGLYASDHDMFAFLVNDEAPVEVGNAQLGRGFFCWNSETGSSTFGLTTFLYNYVCENHIVWGAEDVRELKIIHRKNAPEHFYTQALPLLNEFAKATGNGDSLKRTVETAMNTQIAESLEDTLGWFKNKPFTGSEIGNGWEIGQSEGEDVTTLWGMIQGLTAYARDLPFTDKRVHLERRAGALLKNS